MAGFAAKSEDLRLELVKDSQTTGTPSSRSAELLHARH